MVKGRIPIFSSKKKSNFFLYSYKPKNFASNEKEIRGRKCGMCLIILILIETNHKKTLTC